ncbi:carboxylesterase/lipase family protein [Roseomonas xinghualingensis]|uniref:carboxylesterase/lipase family protein n=1 Tax=Roseomonas xinghualingensis TaxID=2986475 RepID=UPI0021F1A97F|nr:carboxylesterase family protein [Roseomonas sp. SXEYE001]MCV4210402.1 carboxylesterase family protein [Roseomonas sp. SXEYE001]
MPGLHRRNLCKFGAAVLASPPLLASFPATAQEAPIARPPAGALRGAAQGRVLAFKGIPYAAPPVGPLRYRSPQGLSPWTGERDATRAGAASIQTIPPWATWLYDKPASMGEDCLTLNIWTPALEGRRPVMVWIHGGAWRTGEGVAAGNDGTALARLGDVVVVTVNYRLGALGFLAHPTLKDPVTGAAANWGVQDQVAALRWVRANIEAFGGDPDNVTLFGQSAGGTSVANIAPNPANHGLVHKMIIQSGAFLGPPDLPDLAGAAAYAEALAAKLETTVPGLRGVPAERLHTTELALAREWGARNGGRVPVLPIADGVVIPAAPRGAGLPAMPLLIGTTRDEAAFWYDLLDPDGRRIPGLPSPTDEASLLRMAGALKDGSRPRSTASPEAVVDAYRRAAARRGEPTELNALWMAIYTDLRFRLDALEAARRHAASGQPAFLYEFAHPLAGKARGVPHCAEVPFVFGTHTDPYFAAKSGTGPAEAALARAMMQGWSSFARAGVPSSEEGGAWQPVSSSGEGVNLLGGEGGPRRIERVVRAEELEVWGS